MLVGLGLPGGLACGAMLPHPRYVQQPSDALQVVGVAPPPARVENVPPQPKERGAVWIDGEWTWRRGRWAWTLGRWVVPPAGAGYAPWAFQRAADGTLYFAPGSWRDTGGQVIDRPPQLATAAADTVAVVDAEGNTEVTGRTVRATPSAGARESSVPPAPSSVLPAPSAAPPSAN